VCLQTAQTGGESDIVSTQAVWNDLQAKRPDLAEELASPTWHFDRKGEVSEGQRPFFQKPIFYLVKGQPAERVAAHWDPYYVWSLGRHVEAGLIPELSERKKEAMTVLEETAQRLSLHMELEIGDLQVSTGWASAITLHLLSRLYTARVGPACPARPHRIPGAPIPGAAAA
jgi:hypothetical protein